MYHLHGMTVTHHPAAFAFDHAAAYPSDSREEPCPSASFFLTLFLSDMGNLIAYRLTFSKSHSENWQYVFYWLSYSVLFRKSCNIKELILIILVARYYLATQLFVRVFVYLKHSKAHSISAAKAIQYDYLSMPFCKS